MNEELRKQLGVEENNPNDWFETLYTQSSEKGNGVPWANMAPHPLFKRWIDQNMPSGKGKTALVVGCGLGDDAIALEALGYEVTAFDVADSAIDLCKKRFSNSKVNFVQADLIEGIADWKHQFDFVLEIFTVQALPPKYEQTLIENIARFVAPNGQLLVITEVQHQQRSFEVGPPWLLNKSYIASFESFGLQMISMENDQTPEMGDEIHTTLFERK